MGKKISLLGLLIFGFIFILNSCEEDDISQRVVIPSNLSAAINALTDGSGTVTVTPDAERANSYVVEFEEGVSFVIWPGQSTKHTYGASGTYTITIVAYGQGQGTSTITETVTIEVEEPEGDPNEPLFGSWVIANAAGSLGVGPAVGDTSWWTIDGGGVVQRSCYYNDTYVFGEDGSFTNNLGDETWLEGWQSGAGDACGAPVAPHDGSASATYEYNPADGSLKLTGAGAYLGLPKAVNAGELPNVEVPDMVTYQVTLSEDGNSMDVVIEAGTGVFWQYKMVRGDGTEVGAGGDPLETIYTNLVWSDEFDVDGAPDPAKWTYDLGAGGWGNGESQTYTDDPENVRVEGGFLKITAKGSGGPTGVIHYYDDITQVATGGATSVIEDFEGTPPAFT
ncbi:MAG: hypothetical protein AB3N14_16430, partial [Flavobacteriaceae bacterium]